MAGLIDTFIPTTFEELQNGIITFAKEISQEKKDLASKLSAILSDVEDFSMKTEEQIAKSYENFEMILGTGDIHLKKL